MKFVVIVSGSYLWVKRELHRYLLPVLCPPYLIKSICHDIL